MYDIISTYCFTLFSVVVPTLTETPSKQTITEGSKVTFHCTSSGNPVPQIKWIKDGTVAGEGKTLTFDALRNRSGEYWCIADNGLKDTANASAYLDVQCKYDAVYICSKIYRSGIRNTPLRNCRPKFCRFYSS